MRTVMLALACCIAVVVGCGVESPDTRMAPGEELAAEPAASQAEPVDGNEIIIGRLCGTAVCGAGTYCCNASCSLCVPIGNFCTQQVCDIRL